MSYISTNLNFLIAVVKKASQGLSRDFSEIEQLQSSIKGHKEFTEAAVDRTAKILRSELQKFRPQYAIVAKGDKTPSVSHFLISPLDGATNFMHGIPYFSVSVAEVVGGNMVAAVICNPATSDIYFAEKGNGAFKEGYRNHERLRVAARKDLSKAVVCGQVAEDKVGAIRNFGAVSLDLANVASGKFDGIISKGNTAADIAAGVLLVKESGGRVLALEQEDTRTDDIKLVLSQGNIVASNNDLIKKLVDLAK